MLVAYTSDGALWTLPIIRPYGASRPSAWWQLSTSATLSTQERICHHDEQTNVLHFDSCWSGGAAAACRRPQSELVKARNIVLVHGSYADGSSWLEVISYVQAAGMKATAVQNPLSSLADDVAATKRILALQDGPILGWHRD